MKQRNVEFEDPRVTLLDLLRERHRADLEPRKVAIEGNAAPVRSSSTAGGSIPAPPLALSCDGAEIVTIDGLANGDALHPVQAAFIAHDGFQCGFWHCGQTMSAVGLIEEGMTFSSSVAFAAARRFEASSSSARRYSMSAKSS